MIPAQLEAITSNDLNDLIANEVRESRSIEYKRQLPGNSDTDKSP